MALHVKKGDMVQIIAGDHKGATGRVLHVIPAENKVVIQGHNTVKKHVRPSRRNPQGGRINIEQPMHVSNVLLVNPKTGRGQRVRYQMDENGGKKRVATDGTDVPDGTIRRAK
jgi:large subunit ribosomal protein L24